MFGQAGLRGNKNKAGEDDQGLRLLEGWFEHPQKKRGGGLLDLPKTVPNPSSGTNFRIINRGPLKTLPGEHACVF